MQQSTQIAKEKYLRDRIECASAIGRIIILYEGCLRFLNESKEAIAAKDKPLFCEKVIRAQNIIRELRNALNMDLEPQISGNLYRLYTYFLKRLSDANRTKKTDSIDFVISQVSNLCDTWKKIEEQGLAKDVKRYEERLGMTDVNILRKYKTPSVSAPAKVTVSTEKVGPVKTLNLSI